MDYLVSYLKPLSGFLCSETSIEVCVNHDGSVWIESAGDTHMKRASSITMEPEDVRNLAGQIANNRSVALTEDNPLVSASINYEGLTLRCQIAVPPATGGGAVMSFRVFRSSVSTAPKKFSILRKDERTLAELRADQLGELREHAKTIMSGDGDSEAVDALMQLCIDYRLNVVVSGGTSTGKTELGRRLLWMVPPEERIVTIEDSTELLPNQPNVVGLIADRDEKSSRSAAKLLQATLRLRPDRIIVGELRGDEVVTFLDAINTGHSGSFTTIHADTAEKALDRLAFMVLNTGTQLTYSETIKYLRNSVDVIIQSGRMGPERGIQEIYFPGADQSEAA